MLRGGFVLLRFGIESLCFWVMSLPCGSMLLRSHLMTQRPGSGLLRLERGMAGLDVDAKAWQRDLLHG
jgi:hypothetical protein